MAQQAQGTTWSKPTTVNTVWTKPTSKSTAWSSVATNSTTWILPLTLTRGDLLLQDGVSFLLLQDGKTKLNII